MSVELKNKKSISINEMKDGQIAEIVEWGGASEYHGTIIQRYGGILIAVGKDKGYAFTTAFESSRAAELRVRVLEDGEVLIVKNNQ